MIQTFRHKGLRRFFEKSDQRGIPAENADRIRRILDLLHAARVPEDMNLPGYHFHSLKGDRKGTFTVRVTGNLRITFGFEPEGANDIDLEDYH